MDKINVAQIFWENVFPMLLTALMALVGWLLKQLVSFLTAKSQATGAGAASVKFTLAMSKLTQVVLNVVADANVTLKPKLAGYLRDGKIDEAEGKQLRDDVLQLIKDKAGPELLAFLRAELGGLFENVLGGLLERAVVQVKAEAGPKDTKSEEAPVPQQP